MNKQTLDELRESWHTLYQEIKKSKKFNFELFESAFSQTYALLAEEAGKDCLSKELVHLVSVAFLFAGLNDSSLANNCLAAAVLTERMLNSYAFRNTTHNAESTVVYLLESREELVLDFNDVTNSITKLVKVFDNAYWNNLCN